MYLCFHISTFRVWKLLTLICLLTSCPLIIGLMIKKEFIENVWVKMLRVILSAPHRLQSAPPFSFIFPTLTLSRYAFHIYKSSTPFSSHSPCRISSLKFYISFPFLFTGTSPLLPSSFIFYHFFF